MLSLRAHTELFGKPGVAVASPGIFCPALSNVVSSYNDPGDSSHPRVLFQMEF